MMDLVLLAAGMGTRLGQLTENLPKALIKPDEKTLLEHALESFLGLPWIDRAIVVTGFQRDQVVSLLNSRTFSKPVVEVYNSDYKMGNFYSLNKGLSNVSDEWVITNVDHIFPKPLLEKAYQQSRWVSAICDSDRPLLPDCMKVEASQQGGAYRINAISKKLNQWTHGYIGMTFVRADGAETYKRAALEILKEGSETAYAEMVLERLALKNMGPFVDDVSGFRWLEIDDKNDLSIAEKALDESPAYFRKS